MLQTRGVAAAPLPLGAVLHIRCALILRSMHPRTLSRPAGHPEIFICCQLGEGSGQVETASAVSLVSLNMAIPIRNHGGLGESEIAVECIPGDGSCSQVIGVWSNSTEGQTQHPYNVMYVCLSMDSEMPFVTLEIEPCRLAAAIQLSIAR